jgi:hypothetical protein
LTKDLFNGIHSYSSFLLLKKHIPNYHADEHKPVATYEVVHHAADHDDVKYVKHDDDHYHRKPAVYEKESHSYEDKPTYTAPVYTPKSYEYVIRFFIISFRLEFNLQFV